MEKIKESTHLNAESKLLDPEFEHTAVPLEYRKNYPQYLRFGLDSPWCSPVPSLAV